MNSKKRGIFNVVLVLSILVLFSLSTFSQDETSETLGCYYFPEASEDYYCLPDILYSDAQADCALDSNCDINQYFTPGSDCSEFTECEEINCNVDCTFKAKGKCEAEGGSEVINQDEECIGCCVIEGTTVCDPFYTKFECYQLPNILQGATVDDVVWLPNEANCQQYCQQDIEKATITGTITETDTNPLSGVQVEITIIGKQTTSAADGTYTLSEIMPGDYEVKASLDGYLTRTFSVSLTSGETVQLDFEMQEITDIGEITGIVIDGINPLAGARISYSGPTEGYVLTETDGSYVIPDLPYGSYDFIVSKSTYQAVEETVELNQLEQTKNFVLSKLAAAGVRGVVYLDQNGNGMSDVGEEKSNVKIFVDSNLRGFSTSNGIFEITDISSGSHRIFASYQGEYNSEVQDIEVVADQVTEINLLLTAYSGECSFEEKVPEEFVVYTVPGKAELELRWVKPCREVLGYKITRNDGQIFTVSSAQDYYFDNVVNWEESYSYEIVAVYSGTERESAAASYDLVYVGDEICKDKYDYLTNNWLSFCLVEDGKRQTVWWCYDNNVAQPYEECDGNYYCTKTGENSAGCKSAGECNLLGIGDPFGMYHNKDSCYGSNDVESVEDVENFCVFDYNNTIVDECKSCTEITSCYDYQGEDACTINSCLTKDCRWVSAAENLQLYAGYENILSSPFKVTLETGKGYCVEDNYPKEDKCSLCGPEAEVLENYYCTGDVCAGLGKCYSTPDLDTCESCPETPTKGCYSYNSELECINNQNTIINGKGEVTLSNDRCGWGRCYWDGASCFKDGNGDTQDDCNDFSDSSSCRKDVSAPLTKISSEGVKIVTLTNPELSFLGSDAYHEHTSQKSNLLRLSHCLTSADSMAADTCVEKSDFTNVDYSGRLKEETLDVNLLESEYLNAHQINGENYLLKFYSTDKYLNQENVKKEFVVIDNVAPQFVIEDEYVTLDGLTTLTVMLRDSEEEMSCTLDLEDHFGTNVGSEEFAINVEDKTAVFSDLDRARYTLNVACEDKNGNEKSIVQPYTFDLEENIDIIYPPINGYIAEQEIEFQVNTKVEANCVLYKNNVRVENGDFLSSDGLTHQTVSIPGFTQGEYTWIYSVYCEDLINPSEGPYEEYFQFNVDFFGPDTVIILEEDDRTIRIPAKKADDTINFDWIESFISKVDVSFECTRNSLLCGSDHETYYCLGEDCLPFPNTEGYESVTEVPIESIIESTRICYYSSTPGTEYVKVICGEIVIDGYSIVLEKPERFTFQNEQWGISNVPLFDWQFYTRMETSECKFDFTSGFNYENIPTHKTREKNSEGKYLFEDFPINVYSSEYSDNGGVKKVYVKCDNGEGEISSEEIMNLEYDPSAPQIVDAYADPNKVEEGISTNLFVETDDKTVCKYSDDSDDAGSSEYGTMEFTFPKSKKNILEIMHEDTFHFSFLGPKKDFILNTVCKNGAGNFSEMEEIEFNVDYTALGNIISLFPESYIASKDVTLEVVTSKNGYCEYKTNNSEYAMMDGAGSTIHTKSVTGLSERKYTYPVRCILGGDHKVENKIEFTVDLTAPKITKVDDGYYSCGNDEVTIFVQTNEESIIAYYYEVYDLGSANRSSSMKEKVYNNTIVVDNESSLTVPLPDINESNKYMVKVMAQDAAGNWGEMKESDGFLITDEDYLGCEDKDLDVKISQDDDCSAVKASMECETTNGCKILFGQSASESDCKPENSYTGQNLIFTKKGWVCYFVEDNSGRNRTGKQKINFVDEDGDGYLDSCDECPDTKPGKVADDEGCADGQVPKPKNGDSDGDGLPDIWEKNFNSESCPFNYLSRDSDDDGVSDALADYDDDGFNNYREYKLDQDPCRSDEQPGGTTLPPPPVYPDESDYLAWILLIIGLLCVLGGTGYLIYYYNYSPQAKLGGQKKFTVGGKPISQKPAKPSLAEVWKNKLLNLKKKRAVEQKEKSRRNVFSAFGKKSPEIPHLEKVLRKDVSHQAKVGEIARKYVQNKELIDPGLKKEEKDVFNKLANIAKGTKKKKVNQVVNKTEAKDIFSQLKDISKKRKKK